MPLSSSANIFIPRHAPLDSWSEEALRELYRNTMNPAPDRAAKAAATRKLNREEVVTVEQLLQTGSSSLLTMKLAGETLLVYGQARNEVKLLFTLDKTILAVHSKRSKHLIPLLTKLAEAEGVELVPLAAYNLDIHNIAPVLFWQFAGSKEVDDTELVKLARPRRREEQAGTFVGDPGYYSAGILQSNIPF